MRNISSIIIDLKEETIETDDYDLAYGPSRPSVNRRLRIEKLA
jgi:hypothetical protein